VNYKLSAFTCNRMFHWQIAKHSYVIRNF